MSNLIHFETEFYHALHCITQNKPYTSQTGTMQLDNKDILTDNNIQLSVGENRIYIEDGCIKWYCSVYMNKTNILVDMNKDCPTIHTTNYTDTHGIVFKQVDTVMDNLLQNDCIKSYAYSRFK